MRYRVVKRFSQNPETGYPESNYMLQQKRSLQPWQDVRLYVLERDAQKAKDIKERQ